MIAGLASMFVVYGSLLCVAAPPVDATAWNLKTPAPDAAKVKSFLDGISSLRSDIEKSGKIPVDAKTRLSQVNIMAANFLQQSQTLVSLLKQNNETAAFDALIDARLQKSGHSGAISEIKKFGGAFAVLVSAKKDADEDIADLTTRINAKLPGTAANIIVGGVLALFETQNAEAIYGGGVSGHCSYVKIVYYMAIGVHPDYCIS